MIYKNIDLIPYELELDRKLQNSQLLYNEKKGYILKLYVDEYCGCGEVCLLENYSKESLKQVMWIFEEIKIALISKQKYSKEDFLNIFKLYSRLSPSLNFALDIALYDVLSQKEKLSLAGYINKNALENINLCGSYLDNVSKDKHISKIKLLCENVEDDIKKVSNLIRKSSVNRLFRLDANRGYSLNDAIKLCKSIDLKKIQYFEEPIKNQSIVNYKKLKDSCRISIAIDESIYDSDYKSYINSNLIDYVVFKPSIFGSLNEILNFQKYVSMYNVKIVISSSLENYIGNLATIHIAAAMQAEDTYSGINNLLYYNYSDKVFYNKNSSKINIKNIIGLGACFNDK
tara:strand:- start:378 stop:1409 length:1032 start_codon:yes stop_codon:yes gene_type:complete